MSNKRDNNDFYISHQMIDLIRHITNDSYKDIVSHFWRKKDECMRHKPNVRRMSKDNEPGKRFWVYKDYYPNSPVFFKMTVCDPGPKGFGDFIFTRVSFPDRGIKDCKCFSNDVLGEIGEAELLNTDIRLNTKKHRRMAPKGMKYVG